MSCKQVLIEETDIARAWSTTLDVILKKAGNEISPLLLTLTEFNETQQIRDIVDSDLRARQLLSTRQVSETIFPESLYHFVGKDRKALYKEYAKNLPRLRGIDVRNGQGTYFQRMIAYPGSSEFINQLEIIITSLQDKNVRRRSKLQASIFNPIEDHTNKAYQGFPCLQHVTVYESSDGGLILNSFYAIQYLYKKAYGNWLGLVNLGKFIARESQMEFKQLNCYIGVEKLDTLSKSEAKTLFASIT